MLCHWGGVTHSKEVGETANGTPVEITRPERLEIFGEVNGVVAENGGTLKVIAPTIDITSNTEDVVSAVGGTIEIGDSSTTNVNIINNNLSKGYAGIFALSTKPDHKPSFVDVTAQGQILIKADVGVWTQQRSQKSPDSDEYPVEHSTVNLTASSVDIQASGHALIAYSNSEINILGNATISAPTLISTRGLSIVNINVNNPSATTILKGNIGFETDKIEGVNGSPSGELIDSFVNINLNGKDSSWTGRSYQWYKVKVEGSNDRKVVETSVIGENRDYHGQVTGLKLAFSNGATWNSTGDSFANVLSLNSGNINLSKESTLHTTDFNITGDENNLNFAEKSNVNGVINDKGTLYINGDTSAFTGTLNVIGKAAVGFTPEQAAETLKSTEGSVLLVKAGSTLNGNTIVGANAAGTNDKTNALSVLSGGTLAILATEDYVAGTPLVTVGTANTEAGSTIKLVNATQIADGTQVFATTSGTEPSEYTLVTDNLLKVVKDNQVVTEKASVALGSNILIPNVVEAALLTAGAGADRIIALTTDTTAAQAAAALNNIALMGTASGAQTVVINASNMLLDVVDGHGSVLAGYAHAKSGADLWIDINGSFSKAGNYSAGLTDYGYKSDLSGVTVGSDYAFGNGYAAGLAVSFGKGSVRGQGNGAGIKNDVDYFGANLYGVWSNDYFNMIGSVGYLQSKNEIKAQGFKGKPDVKVTTVGVRVEKPLALNEAITVTPHVGVRYKHIKMDSFSTGGFDYRNEKANLVEVPFGVAFNANVKAPCGAEVKPFIDLTIAPNFGDRKVTNRVALSNSAVSDSFDARIANNAMYNAKIGVNAVKDNHSFGLNYGIGSGNYGRVDQTLQAKYRYQF